MIFSILLSCLVSVRSESLIHGENKIEINSSSCFNDNVPDSFYNVQLNEQNPSSNCPPSTDNGAGMEPFKYPFSFAVRNLYPGGWGKRITVTEFPIAKNMVGDLGGYNVLGAIRQMHYHKAAEWFFILYSQVRITIVDKDGRAFIDDVKSGNLLYFPPAVPYSIQTISDQDVLLVAGYNKGDMNSVVPNNLVDWLIYVPLDVLAKNFQVPKSTFNNLQKQPVIFKGKLPHSLEVDREEASRGTGYALRKFSFHADKMKPNVTRKGGHVKIIDRNNFPITEMSFAIVTLKPGAMRELHWHPNADERQYYIKGKARMGIFQAGNQARTMDFQAGDVGYVTQALGHYIENTGQEDVVFVEAFPVKYYEDISLAEWLAHTPPVLVNEHIRTGQNFINNINKNKVVIVP